MRASGSHGGGTGGRVDVDVVVASLGSPIELTIAAMGEAPSFGQHDLGAGLDDLPALEWSRSLMRTVSPPAVSYFT